MEITKGMVEIQAEAGAMPAFLARPSGTGSHPGVVVVQEAFGLNENIKKVADRIAGEGYAAIAPDLYYREAKRVVAYDDLTGAIGLMNGLVDDKVVKDMNATITYLQ